MNKPQKRLLSFLLAAVMLLSMFPQVPLTVRAAENTLEGKTISILGDSISTFAGYIPAADGTNLEHKTFYPKHDVTSVDATWWMKTVTILDATLGVNESWSGSRVLNTIDGNSGNLGEDAAMASLTRIRNLGSNGAPDVILFFGGTNDIAFDSPLGSFDPTAAPAEADLTATKWTTYADAYTAAIMRMQHYYPEALILCIFPTENGYYYDAQTRLAYTSVMADICDHYGVSYLDPMAEGFDMDSMLGDVTHPNAAGMTFIASCVARKLLSEHIHAFTASVTAPTCTEQGYTTYTCECGDSYVDDYVDATGHNYENGVCTACGTERPNLTNYEGKTVSILGDSISTMGGVSNNANYNSTIGSNAVYYSNGSSMTQADTWWQQTIDVLDMELLVNNSWSGSCILHTRSNTVGAYIDRCVQLHNDHTGEEPDVIWVFMGTNDFSYYQSKLGTADIDYGALIVENSDGSFTYATPTTSCEAYAIMLHKMTQRYPNAEIYCMNLLTRRATDYTGDSITDVGSPTAFNAELAQVITHFGASIVDLENCGITSDEATFDTYIADKRVHPNKAGMDLMTEAVVSAILGKTSKICTITNTLTGVINNNSSASALIGGNYTAELSAESSYSNMTVTVTMNGEDVTEDCYADGKITIPDVTGDIVISAAAQRVPLNFRWDFSDGELVSTGDSDNALTKLAGSTANSVFTDTRYQLNASVILKWDQPWVLEWKGEGTGGFMLSEGASASDAPFFFRRAGNYLNAFGDHDGSKYNNYGIALDTTEIDGSGNHVYRLENRIDDDGSNMIYLLVDGEEVGALNHYYVGGTSQNTTGNWISGTDFTINYIGTSSHPLTNYAMEYLAVWEAGQHTHSYTAAITAPTCTEQGYTTHTCDCGDSYTDNYVEATGHSWENGLCGVCGAGRKPYQRVTYFTVDVKADNGKNYTDNAVLYLPANYTPNGEPVKLVIYCKQGSSQITASSNPIEAVGFYNYLISLGYAVLGVDGVPDAWRDELGLGERAVGNPMAVQGTEKAYDYVIENYNIAADGCFISGYSQGGHYAQNVVDLTDIPILAAAEQSPVCSMRYHQWDLNANVTVNGVKFTKAARLNVARIYGFPAVTNNTELLDLAYDASLVAEYDPWVRNSKNAYTGFVQKSNLWYLPEGTSLDDITMTKTVKCPVKIWCAEDDTAISADVMKVFVKSIQNAGGTAEISVAPSGGHGFFQKQTAVGTFTENGKPYDTLPIAVEIARWFQQYGGYACEHTYTDDVCTACGEKRVQLSLRYDDHYDVSGKTVEILDPGTPTSFKVGYGVAEGTPDDAVVTLDGDTLVATGIGTAKVKIDGQLYEVTVTAAPISLILLAGQSNMQGSEGDENQSIVCPDGMVYATYGDRYTMTTANATNFAPSALTGDGSELNVNGTTEKLEEWPVYLLNEAGVGKKGPDSGFAYEWVQQTGEKVWIVNAAHGGSSITTWQDGGANYEEAILLFSACQETLRQEIAAGHYTLSHMGYFWCQGCTDYSKTAQWYVEKYLTMHGNFKTELAFDHDSDAATADKVFEFGGIIPVRAGHEYYTSYRQGVYTDTTTKKYHESFLDLRFTGPRVAQYWMGNNPDLEDIWVVCNIGENWVWMPDGTNGVSDYFQAHYENGTVDYETQVAQKASWYTPTTPAAVHDSIHYNQIGYNEVGRESVRNALIMLGEVAAPETETSVEFLTWDGYTPASEITAATAGSSGTLVVPRVYPLWKAKTVDFQLSDGLRYEYYDLLADSLETSGTLSAAGSAVTVAKGMPNAHFADHLSSLPEEVCCGLNLWAVLEHDEYFYSGGTHWAIHSSGTVRSVTIPAAPGDMIYASAFGKAGENGHASSNGIRVTFFDDYGVAKTLAPAETYAEFTANGGYLIAPEGTVAVNIPMWTDSEEWELYLLSRDHDNPDGICSICGKDSHIHNWSDWETVTEPGMDGPGKEKRSCACGQVETRVVESIWQTTNILDHWNELPEDVCSGLNLWSVLEHDPKYYIVSQGDWGYHSSRNVPSVTFALNPGDRLFATSFGAADVNGHGSQGGIRVTFFDINGVVKTMTPAETYAEFTANGGCLVAPAGTIAVNVAMWNNSDDNEIYILNREHSYSGVSCAVCGGAHPEAANYAGKVISIMGDSISTFAGYIPTADGFNLEHLARYPQDNLLTDVNETWWMQVISGLDGKLGINDSWRGATVSGAHPVTSGTSGENAAMSNLTRIRNLGSNGTPDVILLYGGTNDLAHVSKVGTFDPATAPTQVDLTTKKWDNLADGYVHTLLRLKHFYPDAQILAMLPTYTTSYYSDAKLAQANEVLAAICDHYGVAYVDLRDCGITTADLPDGIHPDARGMDFITGAVLDSLMENCTLTAGENVVYKVSHNLTGVQASLGHYKGISQGKPFVETLTADNDMTVTVTMGGEEITASVYADGQISIASVSGDLVITAEAKFSLGDRLQQLPEHCRGLNLWPLLEHDTEYYSADGWTVHPSGKVRSVTVPVTAGEKICASSFGAASENGGTINGIRVTFFSEDGVLISMSAPDVYAEFTKNGYITAPENAVAVNIPMWTDSSGWELYLLNREHEYESVVTAPTCTEQGFTTHTCTICGDSYADTYVEAAGHCWGDWEVVTEPAHDHTGLQERSCTACGETEQEEIPKLEILYGDANGDGAVNAPDLILLRQYLAGWDVTLDMNAADANGDGTVNALDLILLRQHLAGWDVTLGPKE